MILVDTSIWIDHLRNRHRALEQLLGLGAVLGHPWVIGELALGHLSQRGEILRLLSRLPEAVVATPTEILTLIEHHQIYGLGIGYVDAQLLASTLLTPDAKLWTNDKPLAAVAARLGLTADPRAPGDEP